MSHSNYELGANGSAVTLFADPENAVSVNEGVTLIPWMGDSSNLIDRYDVRGHLYSESEFGLRKNDTDVDIEEAKLEEELDKERFMFLTVDELEFEAYLEEEEKRFNNKKKAGGPYLQVDFSYQGPSENVPQTVSKPTSISEEVYVPDKTLAVPDGMLTPKTDKHYKVVEKTAAFLSTQNLQTEIVIRTKQKDNPIFHFLEPDHELNPFYKHVLSAIKRKIIVIQSEAKPKPVVPSAAEQQAALEAQQRAQLQAQQLHAQQQQEALIAQQQEYERQQQLAHQQLLARQQNELQQNSAHAQWNKIGGELLHSGEKKGVGSSLAALSAYGAASDSDNSDSDDEAEKNPSTLNSMINNMSKPIPVPPGTSPEVIQYLIMSGFVALPPPAPGLPQLLVPPAGYEGFSIPTAPPPPPPEEEVQITTEEPEECQDIERPASPNAEQKGIITKLAEYVVKNGDSFERKVQKKQDTRFAFVNPGNEHHNYYQYLIQKFRNKRVKLNVAPIKIKSKSSQLNPTANVDSTVFNQSSSEDEESKEESEELTQSSNLTTSSPQRAGQISRSPSRSPLPLSSSLTESRDTDSVSQETAPVSQSLSSPLQSPHPLDSDPESSPPPSSDRQYSPSKTPVYTQETEDRTPSPNRTPQDDRTQTPEIKLYPSTPLRPEVDSDVESVDSETKGRPLVQHFSDDDSELDSRYDLDGKRSRSPSPAKSRSRSRSVQKEGEGSKSVISPDNHTRSQKDSETKSRSPKKSRSRSVSLKRPRSRTKSRSPKRSRTRTRSYSRSRSESRRHGSETPNSSAFKSDNEELIEKQRQEKEELRQREESLNQREELLRKKEELLKKKEEELPEEGEISDGSAKRKHKKHVSSRGRSRSKSPSKHKKKKKDRSHKREGKSSRSESRSSSRKKQKIEHKEDHKRKKPTPPRKSDTDEWMSEKMKKLSKIELLKEIEDKLEEKKKLREQKEESPKPKIASSEKSSKKDKRDKHNEKKDGDSTSDKHTKETKSSGKNGSHSAKEADTKEGKKESKFDEEKRLAMEKELAQIEAKLQAKKLKKSKDVVDETKKKVNDKANGHSEKSKNKKHKKERSKEKKS